ncbi:TonB-dependent receptor [Pseudomaricurvus alkylphenolicus]|nr:TonB-dependent receptor [Pseudomaricurvus alkylphenolicus]
MLAADLPKSFALEEIVVTATKRSESLQDVSISMLATDGEAISDMGITRGSELTANLPAITIAQNPVGNFIFIRGIGSSGANQGIEQSVSIFHDGTYMGRHQLSRAPFLDIERVEVLRGPQSILFGKNTIGGAIHVIGAKPTDEFEGSISGLYGEDGEKEFTAVVSGPITDSLSGRLAYRGYQMDGYIDNILTDDDGPERDDETLRLQLSWTSPNDNLKVLGKWEHSEFETKGGSVQVSTSDPTGNGIAFDALNRALVGAAVGSSTLYEWDEQRAMLNDGGELLGLVLPEYAGMPGFPDINDATDNEMDTGSLTVNWYIGEHTLTSITAYAGYEYQDLCDCDFVALPLLQVDAIEDYEQYSQEIRLTSPGGEKLDYIVGLYYHRSDLTYSANDGFGSSLASGLIGQPSAITPNLTRSYTLEQEQEMWSVFGQATYSFSEETRLILGARYFEETKTADHILDTSFADGWDYSAAAGLPAGSLAYGNTPEEYDRFLSEVAGTPLAGFATISETIFSALLGTFEHSIVDRERDEEDWMFSLTVEHNISPDTMVFFTAATGTKGGGFDARFLKTADNPFFEYDEETATNFELGLKSYLFDNRMSLNATVFHTTVEDYQVSIFDGATAFFVQNAAELEAKGVEVDVRWAATENLTISFAGSYLVNEYAEFGNAPCWTVSGSEPVDRGNCVDRGTPEQYRDAEGESRPRKYGQLHKWNLRLI